MGMGVATADPYTVAQPNYMGGLRETERRACTFSAIGDTANPKSERLRNVRVFRKCRFMLILGRFPIKIFILDFLMQN